MWLLSSVELPQPELSTFSRKDQVLRKAIPDPAPGIRERWWSTDLSHDLVMIGCQTIASGQTVPGSRPREHSTRQTGLHCKPNETSAYEFSGGTGHLRRNHGHPHRARHSRIRRLTTAPARHPSRKRARPAAGPAARAKDITPRPPRPHHPKTPDISTQRARSNNRQHTRNLRQTIRPRLRPEFGS